MVPIQPLGLRLDCLQRGHKLSERSKVEPNQQQLTIGQLGVLRVLTFTTKRHLGSFINSSTVVVVVVAGISPTFGFRIWTDASQRSEVCANKLCRPSFAAALRLSVRLRRQPLQRVHRSRRSGRQALVLHQGRRRRTPRRRPRRMGILRSGKCFN